MADDAIAEAFRAHKAGQTKFTRRMAIIMADHFGMTPMQMVRLLERRGLLRSGSAGWFKANGGITREHIAEARHG